MDAIVMVHVIEHLPSVRAALTRCFELLRPGGLLVLRYPAVFTYDAKTSGRDAHIAPWHF